MAFLKRRLGDTVELKLAELTEGELAEALEASDVTVRVKMVSPLVRDHWDRIFRTLPAMPSPEEAEKLPQDDLDGRSEAFRDYALAIVSDSLAGVSGLHDDVDGVTDGEELAEEIYAATGFALLTRLAAKCRSLQFLTARQEKS